MFKEARKAIARKVMEIQYPFIRSPNYSKRYEPVKAIVIHYTAGGNALNTTKWFQNKQSRVSAHFVVGRKGQVFQCVDLTKVAWHAGASAWQIHGKMTHNLNKCSIGIELANRGRLTKIEDEFYYQHGRKLKLYDGPVPIKSSNGYWELYPAAQIQALQNLITYLDETGIDTSTIVGHEEIALPKGRKIDPGPLFPWNLFRN